MGSKFIEKFSGVFLVAGLFLFLLAFVVLAVVPVWMVEKLEPTAGLPQSVPRGFQADYKTADDYQKALFRGRDIYVREACWHCHSQFVRPTANENLRYGPVSLPNESQTALHLPQLFGTRRVGPDLSREAGIKSNDWHYAHLYKPTNVVPESVMPEYPWLFETGEGAIVLDEEGEFVEDSEGNPVREKVPVPTADGKALVAYLQWLGQEMSDPYLWEEDTHAVTLPPTED